MRNLSAVAFECKRELDALNIRYGNVVEFRVNSRVKSRWGRCSSIIGGFVIEVSERLLHDEVPMESLKNTIIHELLHTCKGCQNHGTTWKRLADKVNRAYGYNIKRTTSASEKGVQEEERVIKVKHRFACSSCGQIIERERESKFTKNYDRYRCGCCGGTFKKIF